MKEKNSWSLLAMVGHGTNQLFLWKDREVIAQVWPLELENTAIKACASVSVCRCASVLCVSVSPCQRATVSMCQCIGSQFVNVSACQCVNVTKCQCVKVSLYQIMPFPPFEGNDRPPDGETQRIQAAQLGLERITLVMRPTLLITELSRRSS